MPKNRVFLLQIVEEQPVIIGVGQTGQGAGGMRDGAEEIRAHRGQFPLQLAQPLGAPDILLRFVVDLLLIGHLRPPAGRKKGRFPPAIRHFSWQII